MALMALERRQKKEERKGSKHSLCRTHAQNGFVPCSVVTHIHTAMHTMITIRFVATHQDDSERRQHPAKKMRDRASC